jgi:membrane protein
MLICVEGLDATTKRSNHSGAELRARVRAQARLAREFGEGGLRFTDKVRLAYWNAFQHDCLNNAKATAFSAIFTIFPAVGVIAAVMTLLPDAAPLRTQWEAVLNRALPASVASLFEAYFTASPGTRQSTGVLLGAAATSIWGAAGVLATLMEGFRRAYDVSDTLWGPGFRGAFRKQLQSFLLVPIALVPLAIASALVIFGHLLLIVLMRHSPMGWDVALYWTANVIRWVAALSATAAVLASVYRFGLPLRPKWRRVVPGAAFATATWFVSTLLFGVYVTHFANYSRVYGSLGTGVVLLLWLFLTALAVLCGAELNAELARDAVLHAMPSQPMPAESAAPLMETAEREESSTHARKGSR